jgi:hypothetical protein
VRKLFERDPSAREEYEALRSLESSLERQGDRAREVIEASQRIPDRVGAQQVLATLTKLAEQSPSTPAAPAAPAVPRALPPPRKRLAPVWFALAAALVAALAWAWWARPQKAPPEKEILLDSPTGAAELALVAPVGPVKQYAPFQWTAELQPGGWFEVEVFDPNRPGHPFLRSKTVLETHWSPPPDQEPDSWPPRIEWKVKQFDRAGNLQDNESILASLQP